jgi:serine/threonine protein kinase
VKAKVIESNMLNQVVQEIKLQAFISNPNIVQFYGLVSDQDNIYIILEYMQGGTLFDYMNDKQKLTEDETAGFIREITNAVKSLHDMNIAHRDIKPENIVLNYGVAKLCDFGWSARVQGSRKTYCGTFDYAPPEILERKEYDLSVDLWNLGVLAYELMTGKIPFEHE